MKKAILSICIDEQNAVDVRFEWQNNLIVPMFGWIEVAKDWLLNRLKENWNIASPDSDLLTVWKSDALWHYLEVWKTIEQRIQAINKSDPNAKFSIDTDLLKKL